MQTKRHKTFYFESIGSPDITRIVLIMRKPKPKSRIRRVFWRAWHYKFG